MSTGASSPPPTDDAPHDSPSRARTRWVWLITSVVALSVGAAVLLLQWSFIESFARVGLAGYGLQDHLSKAADGLGKGDYAAGEIEYQKALKSSDQLAAAAESQAFDALTGAPGLSTAILNIRELSSASIAITAATGELLSLYGDLSGQSGSTKIFSDGAIDLERLRTLPTRVQDVEGDLSNATEHLASVTTGTRFSQGLDEVRNLALAEMAPVQQAVSALSDVAPVLPDALGASGPRRYLVAIGNQAEMRASFGAPLTLVLVEFDDGRISIPVKGQTSTELFPPLNAPVHWFGPAYNPFFLGNQRNRPFVVSNTHPSLLFSGQEMAGAWTGGNYPEVDGVIAIDLTAIASVLEATGPIESSVYGTVDAQALGQILLIDAYQEFGQDDAIARQAANQQLLDELLARILSGEDAINVAQAIASTAPGRHFQVWMRDRELEALAVEAHMAGVVQSPKTGDWSAMYTQNGNQSKVDVFQERNQLVVVTLREDGGARVRQTLTLTNATPPGRPEGPPERIGYETSWLKNAYILYVPKAADNYQATYPQGFTVRPFKGHGRRQLGGGWINDGLGNTMIRIVGWTPPGGRSAIDITYDLPAGTFLMDSEAGAAELKYVIRAEPQALFQSPTFTVQVTGPAGWVPVSEPGMKIDGPTGTVSALLDRPVDIAMEFRETT